jgi:hypothetical protein
MANFQLAFASIDEQQQIIFARRLGFSRAEPRK